MFHCRTSVWMAFLIALSVGSVGVHAHKGHEPARFMGTYIGGGILGGTGLLTYGGYREDLPSWTVGGYARVSSILQLIDIQMEYLYRRHSVRAQSRDVVIQGHGVRLSTNLHPFFIHLLRNSRWWTFVSGLYLQGGGGVEYVITDPQEGGSGRTEWAPTVHIGAGWDIPLDNPADGGGFWLGFNYRYTAVFMEAELGKGSDVHGHSFLLSLGYRSNGLNFMRVERPPELPFH